MSSRSRRGAGMGINASPRWYVYAIILAFVLGGAYPLWWSFIIGSSDKSALTSTFPPLLPGGQFWANAAQVFDTIDFWKALGNSVIVASVITCSVVFFSTLVTAFGVFFMRQYLVDVIPDELIEAARVDGASMISTFFNVGIPAARPAMGILSMFTFMTAWTDYLWPLLVVPQNPTLQVALSQLQSAKYVDYSVVLNGAVLATLPLLVLFVIPGKQLVSGIMAGAVKG